MPTALPYKRLFYALLLGLLAYWLAGQFQRALNFDHTWLLIAAERMLQGGRYAQDFYEPNPPLSILIYVPAVLMAKILPVPLYYTPYLLALICLILSALGVNQILRHWPAFGDERRAAFLAAYIASATLSTSSAYFYFGERDHLVILGLYPFLLAQLSLTNRHALPTGLLWTVLAAGTVATLIKPHFGLLPVLLLFHRMIAHKKFLRIVCEPDFLALALGTLGYIAIIFLFFNDFLTQILPDFTAFYLAAENKRAPVIWLTYCAILLCAALLSALSGTPFQRLKLPMLAYLASFIGLILFYLQMKGVFYHLIPSLVFLFTGLGLAIYETGRHYLDDKPYLAPVTAVLIGLFCWGLNDHSQGLTHADYPETPLARIVGSCTPECRYFMFNHDPEIVNQISLYTGAEHASRFPVFWWLPDVVRMTDEGAAERAEAYREKYTHMVVSDLERWQPEVLILIRDIQTGGRSHFSLVEYLARDPDFADIMALYRFDSSLEQEWSAYQPGLDAREDKTLIYDIYRRQ